MCAVVAAISTGAAQAHPQGGLITHARKLRLEDAQLTTDAPADVLYAQLRGVSPEPGAFVEIAGERLKIHAALSPIDAPRVPTGHIELQSKRVWLGSATTAIELVQVQPAGKPRMSAADWFRGLHTQESVVTS